MNLTICPECGGEYYPVQPDGLAYTHTCAAKAEVVVSFEHQIPPERPSEKNSILKWLLGL